ncbi:MAG: poly-beta-1,6-N-acetyl-D-glucosamine biosynthesis protein PgaD [Sporomusaceae bacterium]|nr:poly-beta-1,6-N-acetyl-D-glucosamine biosynthesis protein PgaD [Sporomusaceae bacterium]
MNYILVTRARRDRKKHRVVRKRKPVMHTMLALSIFSLIVLFPVLPQSVNAHAYALIALCTLLFFSGILVGLAIRLVMLLRHWLAIRKRAAAQFDAPHLQNSFLRGIESILSILAWAFLLHLMQPFITAFVWWQGYRLLEEKVFSLSSIEGTLNMLESSVYFGIITFLILLTWSQWNDWRYGRLNRRQIKPLVPQQVELSP